LAAGIVLSEESRARRMWRESSGEKIVSVYSVVEEKGRKKKR